MKRTNTSARKHRILTHRRATFVFVMISSRSSLAHLQNKNQLAICMCAQHHTYQKLIYVCKHRALTHVCVLSSEIICVSTLLCMHFHEAKKMKEKRNVRNVVDVCVRMCTRAKENTTMCLRTVLNGLVFSKNSLHSHKLLVLC